MFNSSRHKSNVTERELVKACIDNDRYYQELLYKRYFDKMLNMCFRYTKDKERAITITNDGFLKVYKKIHLFEFRGSLEGWIRRLVFNAISDHFRKENKYLKFLVFNEIERSQEENALTDIYFDELVQLTERLPVQTKNVFKLYAIEGLTHKEIGKKLGISIGTSKWHLYQARKKLQKLIHQQQNILVKHG